MKMVRSTSSKFTKFNPALSSEYQIVDDRWATQNEHEDLPDTSLPPQLIRSQLRLLICWLFQYLARASTLITVKVPHEYMSERHDEVFIS